MPTPLTTFQLMALRSLLAQGWPAALLHHLLTRCSLDQEGWQQLVDSGLVETRGDSRYWLSSEGKRAYKRESKGRYF